MYIDKKKNPMFCKNKTNIKALEKDRYVVSFIR
jgi:hypothetical protein